MASPITTHVLDTAQGRPAEGIAVALEIRSNDSYRWQPLDTGTTNRDGRVTDLLGDDYQLVPGTYRLTFDVGAYFDRLGVKSFYGVIPIVFELRDVVPHYHVPLLLSPFGYSTYRGS